MGEVLWRRIQARIKKPKIQITPTCYAVVQGDTMTFSRNQINLRLPPDLLESIDAFLERKYGPVGVSRTRVLEEWIRRGLAQGASFARVG